MYYKLRTNFLYEPSNTQPMKKYTLTAFFQLEQRLTDSFVNWAEGEYLKKVIATGYFKPLVRKILSNRTNGDVWITYRLEFRSGRCCEEYSNVHHLLRQEIDTRWLIEKNNGGPITKISFDAEEVLRMS